MYVVACSIKLLRSSLSSSFCRIGYSLVLLLGVHSAWTQDPVYRRYTVADGMPSNTVYCGLQDSRGFMWFGTDAGAVRFDGRTFRTYTLEDGLTDIEVINLAEDSKGRIWFLTLNGKLCFFLDGAVHNGSTLPDLARYRCTSGWHSFAEDKNGFLWFGGVRNDVLRLDLQGARDSLWHWGEGEISVMRNDEGVVLMSRSQQLYACLDDAWVEIPGMDGALRNSVISSGSRPEHHPIMMTPLGIEELRGQRWSVVRSLPGYFEIAIHPACWLDGSGDCWVRRVDSGVERLDLSGSGPPQRYFAQERINHVYVDSEGNRWFCTPRQGVLLVNARQWTTRSYALGAPGVAALCLVRDHKGRVWAGTAQGGIHCVDGRIDNPDRSDPLLGRVVELATGPDGAIHAATDRCVLRLGLNGEEDLTLKNWCNTVGWKKGLRTMPAKDLCFAPDGTLWTSYFDIWSASIGPSMVLRSATDDRFSDRVPCIHVDPRGRTWFATAKGLYKLYGTEAHFRGELSENMGLRITDITSWSADTLLVATYGVGLRFITNDRVVTEVDMRHGLLSNNVLGVRVDAGKLLVSTTEGLAVGERETRTTFRWTNFTRAHGLPAKEVNDALFDGDGLYVATSNGLCRVPWQPADRPLPPPGVYFSEVAIGPRSLLALGEVTLTRQDPGLSIRFSSIAFADPEAIVYEYRLRDDDPWVHSVTGSLELVSPAAGSYAVSVRARYPDGAWSQEARLPFVVEAAWWERWPARSVAALLLIGLLLFLNTLRTRRKYRQVIAELRERQVIAHERGRIAADIHDDLGADLSLLMQQAKQHAGTARSGPLTVVADGLERTIAKLDEIIWSLDPRRDTLQATAAFIEQHAAQYLTVKGIVPRTQVDLPGPDRPLSAEARRDVLLVVREALRNVVQHAQAKEVWIRWSLAEGYAICQVEDDGVGFKPTSGTRVQNGTRNIQDRAERLRGSVSWQPVLPHGTRLELRFPLA